MEIIITYDIPSKHVDFKKEMYSRGYKDQIPGTTNCKVIYFPNTTLYHGNKTPSDAVADARAVCMKLNVSLERCVATEWSNWFAICGEDFK